MKHLTTECTYVAITSRAQFRRFHFSITFHLIFLRGSEHVRAKVRGPSVTGGFGLGRLKMVYINVAGVLLNSGLKRYRGDRWSVKCSNVGDDLVLEGQNRSKRSR